MQKGAFYDAVSDYCKRSSVMCAFMLAYYLEVLVAMAPEEFRISLRSQVFSCVISF